MKQQTKQQTKQAAKGATKQAATKQENAATVLVWAALLTEIIAGKFGTPERNFYIRAFEYHSEQKTAFPRMKADGTRKYPPMDPKATIERIAAQVKSGTAQDNGFAWSRGSFDDMVVQKFGAQVPKDWRSVLGITK